MNPLYEDYIQGEERARGLFARPPESLFAGPCQEGTWAEGLAAAINQQHPAKETIGGREPVVITGQQTGLFTGPLYTIYKAVTTVQLAERLRVNGIRCVPMFWVAGDDHDFRETQTAHFLTKRHEILSLTYSPRDQDIQNMPMYRVPLNDEIHTFIDRIAQECRGSEYTAPTCQFLHRSLEESDTMADWFTALMTQLFAESDLRFFRPWERQARLAAVPLLAREIAHPLATTRLLQERGAYMADLGYPVPIQRDKGACNFFVECAGRRKNVYYQDGQYLIGGQMERLTVDAMLALLHEAPERFSPNVALRPIVQQQLFPAVAYVAGPGEVAYWAQLQPLFDHFETAMPVVYPRTRCLLTTRKANQLMQQYGFDAATVLSDDDLLARALRKEGGNPALKRFEQLYPQFEDALTRLTRGIGECDDLHGVVRASRQFERRTRMNVERFKRRLLYADTEKRRTAEARVERLRALMTPRHMPQERVLSVFSFIFEHGWPLITRMQQVLEPDTVELQEMEL